MKKYENLFDKKSNDKLRILYEQYLKFEKTGVIEGDELSKIRDEYLQFFKTSGNILLIMERDLLHTIADRWYKGKCKYENDNNLCTKGVSNSGECIPNMCSYFELLH